LIETVITPTVSASIDPSRLTIRSGDSGQLIITITPNAVYSGTINFSCGALPPRVSCTFAPPSLAIVAGSGPVVVALTIRTNAPLSAMVWKSRDGVSPAGLLALAAFWFPAPLAALLGLIRRKRKAATRHARKFWISALLCCAAASIVAGCARSTITASPGTYLIPITLTLSGGATQNVSATVVVE
jgi:hypothetical protein